MQSLRRQATAVASSMLRRAESGSWASTSSSSSSAAASIVDNAIAVGGLDRRRLSLFSISRGFASRRPKVAVLLKEDVDGLGERGATVSVRPGHARNALLPRGVAVILPHPRASRVSRPPRAVLLQRQKEKEEEEEQEKAAARREASPSPSSGSSSSSSVVEEEQDPAKRLVAVARSLSRGAVEFVRPLKASNNDDGGVAASSSSSSAMSRKIADPIDADAFVAAVAAQKRISLDPRLVVLGGRGSDGGEGKGGGAIIDEQGEFSVPLRMKLGGERVVVKALVGLPSSSAGAGGEDGGKKGGGGGGGKKKKGGKR